MIADAAQKAAKKVLKVSVFTSQSVIIVDELGKWLRGWLRRCPFQNLPFLIACTTYVGHSVFEMCSFGRSFLSITSSAVQIPFLGFATNVSRSGLKQRVIVNCMAWLFYPLAQKQLTVQWRNEQPGRSVKSQVEPGHLSHWAKQQTFMPLLQPRLNFYREISPDRLGPIMCMR